MAIGFRQFSNFNGTILAIDGTHVPITNPSTTLGRYINQKGNPTLNFLIACDHKRTIRYMFGGTYGSSHDAFVYASSSLCTWGENMLGTPINGTQYHIIGDSAYPFKPYLIVPYKGCLSAEEEQFNRLIIPQRIIIERTFGHLKTKFQKFRHEIRNGHSPFTSKVFLAACIIYNITNDVENDETG